MNNIYISSIIVFLAVILLLVVILLVAKSYLVASGKVKVTINGDKELEVNSGASLLSTLAENGVLADIVPTLIQVMGREQPKEMTGKSLLVKKA